MQIHYAAARDDFRAVQRQLAKGVSVNAGFAQSYLNDAITPLGFAARSPHASLEMVQMLVRAGGEINPKTARPYQTPLGFAARACDVEKVKFLLEAGADANYVSENRYTPLIHAIHYYANHKSNERTEIVRLLLEAGANPNISSSSGARETPVNIALYFSNFTVLKMLLDSNAKPDVLEWTPLMRAVAVGDIDDVKREIRLGGDIEAHTKVNWTAWAIAVALGDVQKAELVINTQSLYEDDLVLAVRKDNPEMVQWLISLGADPNQRGGIFNGTPLIAAAELGSTECVRILLEAKVDIEAEDESKHRAISRAANAEVVKLLANAGADINYEDGEGYTLLKSAAQDGDDEIVRTLLDLGAKPDASRLDDTPLRVATREDHLGIVKMLLEAGADPNIHSRPDSWCPLEDVQTVETLQVLLDAGADPNITNYLGFKPSRQHTDPELIAMLEKAELNGSRKGKSKRPKRKF